MPPRGPRSMLRTAFSWSRTFFDSIHVIHVYRPIYQAESKFITFRGIRGQLEEPGPHQKHHTHGVGQEVVHSFIVYV